MKNSTQLLQFNKVVLTYTAIVMGLLLSSSCVFAQDWKGNARYMDWSKTGADTSVKQNFKKQYNVLRFGLRPDNKTDNAAQLRKLLLKARPNSILFFPKGDYFFGSSIDIPSNVIIRGEGREKTKFHFKTLKLGQRGAFNISSYDRLSPTSITEEAKLGATEIKVQSTKGYSIGDIIEVFMENDSALMYTQARWKTGWAAKARGQIVKVTAVSATSKTIAFDTPLRLDYKLKDQPAIHKQNGAHNVGFENFTIENYIEEDMIMFYMRACRNCWLDSVTSINVVKHHVLWEASSKCTTINCIFKGAFRFDGGGHGYGVAASNHTSDCRVENCSFSGLRHALMTKKGSNGNAFLYNYCIDGKWDHDETGRPPATVSIHGHYSHFNLFEGNIVERITSADFWGPSGPGTVFYGNVVSSDNLEVRDRCYDQTLIGNLLVSGKLKLSPESIGTVEEQNWTGTPQPLNEYPASLIYTSSPQYFNGFGWPVVENYGKTEISLPAQKDYLQQVKN